MMTVLAVAAKNIRSVMELSLLSETAKNFKPGIYKHYKGDLYHALFVGRHSEARDEEFVVYKSLKTGDVWLRPLKMFIEDVNVSGETQPRFKWVRGE